MAFDAKRQVYHSYIRISDSGTPMRQSPWLDSHSDRSGVIAALTVNNERGDTILKLGAAIALHSKIIWVYS
jgi:hypothetical protein